MVQTDRIKLLALTYPQLVTYLKAGDKLEEELGFVKTGRIISDDVKDMVENFTLPKIKGSQGLDYLFLTFWIVIDIASNTIVAELGFKGVPNRYGEIEIGYGTMPDQQGKGYMSEAVGAAVNWALAREDVKGVLAETHENNLASIRVVQKNGFEQFGKRGEMLWWRRKRYGV